MTTEWTVGLAAALLLAPALAIVGPAAEAHHPPPPTPLPDLDVTTLAKTTTNLSVHPQHGTVIDDAGELETFYDLHGLGEAPDVDFSSRIVLAVVSGPRALDCGFSIFRVSAGGADAAGVYVVDAYTGQIPHGICEVGALNMVHLVEVTRKPGPVVFRDVVVGQPFAADAVPPVAATSGTQR